MSRRKGGLPIPLFELSAPEPPALAEKPMPIVKPSPRVPAGRCFTHLGDKRTRKPDPLRGRRRGHQRLRILPRCRRFAGPVPLDRRRRALHPAGRRRTARPAVQSIRARLGHRLGGKANEYLPTCSSSPTAICPASCSRAGRSSAPRTGSSTRSTSTRPTARPPGSTTTSTTPAAPGPPRRAAPTLLVETESAVGIPTSTWSSCSAGRTSLATQVS